MTSSNTPSWVKDAVCYQIFPDRFAKSATLTKPAHLEAWDTPPTVFGYKGGDLAGITEHLDYLQDLGITAIYLNPIFQSASNHRYHTHDYLLIDPLLGGLDAFRLLRRETSRRNMRLILDGVFNHASRGNFYFNDLLENGPASPWVDWFSVHGWPLNAYDEDKPLNYTAWFNLRALPRWNSDNPQVREYLMQVGEHWVREGIDGWRLDVPNEITVPGFWTEFRERVKAINPDAYITGEIWGDGTPWLHGDQFDGIMNYIFDEAVIQFIGQDYIQRDLLTNGGYHPQQKIDARGYADKIAALLGQYDQERNLGMMNIIDSHDTPRFRTVIGNHEGMNRLAVLLQLTYPGMPTIYYGDELGIEGGVDPDCRRTMPWDHPDQWNQIALAYYKQFVALRHRYPALRTGDYTTLYPLAEDQGDASTSVYGFRRSLPDQTVLVLVNIAAGQQQISIPTSRLPVQPRSPQVVLGPASALTIDDEQWTITIGPEDGLVIVL